MRPAQFTALLSASLLAGPSLASDAVGLDDPGPLIGGAVAVGQSHVHDGPRLDTRLQVWLPGAPLGPVELGFEGGFLIEGDEETSECDFTHSRPALRPDQGAAVYQQCVETAVTGRMLLGLTTGTELVGRLEGGLGVAWRRSVSLDDAEAGSSRWSLSLVGRAVGLMQVGRMMGGLWRVGLSLEGSVFDGREPALGAGLVFEAVVYD